MAEGMIFDIKRYSIHDGTGIRTTVFFKGCPLDCGWCHNPESRRMEPELALFPGRCIGCGLCVKACPTKSISIERMPDTHRETCIVCGSCVDACPSEAREVVGRRITTEEAMEVIERDMPFYAESGGGVTFSGGEPLMQHAFLLDLLEECRTKNIHALVDTSCHAAPDIFRQVAEKSDVMFCDLKLVSSEEMMNSTGVSGELILSNIRWIAGTGIEYRLRVPVIPGVTDTRRNIRLIGDFVLSLPGCPHLILLPYHDTWREKCGRLGIGEPDDRFREGTTPQQCADSLSRRGISVRIEGMDT